MNGMWILIIGMLGILPFIPLDSAFAQTIEVNQTTPCFLNYTAGYKILDDCGMDEDWLSASLIGFEWITGGYFSLILVGLLVMISYIKYHKALYPLLIGVLYLPLAYFLVPFEAWTAIIILVFCAILFTIYKVVKNQTSEFN